jgi:hypothetical protein
MDNRFVWIYCPIVTRITTVEFLGVIGFLADISLPYLPLSVAPQANSTTWVCLVIWIKMWKE